MDSVRSSDGTAIAYERTGDGPPLVIVGGALSPHATDAQLAALLAPRVTVIAYHRRGRGESGDTPPYAVERETEDLRAVIDAAGGAAAVYGSSSGGNLALRAAAAGAPITRIALWEPNFVANHDRPPLPHDYVEHLEELVRSDRRGDAIEYFMTAAVGVPAEFVAPMRGMPHWPAMEAAAHTLAYDGRVVGSDMDGTPPSPQDWAGVTVPVLVLDGGTTPWLTAGAEAIAAALPTARRQTLAGQQHNVAPDAIAPALADFVAQ